jgi:hypothetical protein
MTADCSPEGSVELLPEGFANLGESAAPSILERATKRVGLVHGKHDFRSGTRENLHGMATWIEAQTGKLRGKTMRLTSGVSLLIALSAACSPSIGTETPNPEPTKRPLATLSAPYALVDTPTPTFEPRSTQAVNNPYLIVITPTETSTGPTPTATATPGLRQFPICSLENYRECPLTTEDLLDGSYLRWLNTLSTPFDASKVKLADPIYTGNSILYNKDVKFEDPGESFYRKGLTYGFYISPDGYEANILPVENFSPSSPNENKWVIGIMFRSDRPQVEWKRILESWVKTPPAYRDFYKPELKYKLVTPYKETYAKYPDMSDRINKYAETGDFSYLSGPGLILPATVVYFSPP